MDLAWLCSAGASGGIDSAVWAPALVSTSRARSAALGRDMAHHGHLGHGLLGMAWGPRGTLCATCSCTCTDLALSGMLPYGTRGILSHDSKKSKP